MMSCFRDFDHGKIYPSAKFVENSLCTSIGYVRLMVRLFWYLPQVIRIEAYYRFPLTTEDDKMLEDIQW